MPATLPSTAVSRRGAPIRRHTVVVQLHDRPGALYRAIGLVRRRDYNVSSLVVGASEQAGTSRMVIVVEAADVEQIVQQLMRLVDVVSVSELSLEDTLVRETVLAVVETGDDRAAVLVAAHDYGARATRHGSTRLLLELTAEPAHVDAFVATVRGFGLRQLARTGPIVLGSTLDPIDGNLDPISNPPADLPPLSSTSTTFQELSS
ncbi:MAG: acetolactate synthase small subunit [Gemmatimonadaceae bacterium]|nr:acetolactate synthase small subunit [Gemmatimonadaceae bacterium]